MELLEGAVLDTESATAPGVARASPAVMPFMPTRESADGPAAAAGETTDPEEVEMSPLVVQSWSNEGADEAAEVAPAESLPGTKERGSVSPRSYATD